MVANSGTPSSSELVVCIGGAKEFLVRVSYLEIYNEEIRDLLSKEAGKKLDLKETVDRGVYVKDLMQFVVKGPAEMNNVLQVRLSYLTLHGTATTAHNVCRTPQ
jgi:hypothetical protein